MKFTAAEQQVIKEVKRRIATFHNGDKSAQMVYLGWPSDTKTLIKKGVLTPYRGRETKRILNWYNLTDFGQTII